MEDSALFSSLEDINQTMKQHRKSIPQTDTVKGVLTLLIATPLLLFVLLPSAVLSQAVVFIKRKIGGKKPDRMVESKAIAEQNIVKREERKYDVVVYGATGFTGKLAVRYLTTQYGDKVKWAIAGRNRAALEAVNNQVPIIIADATDREALADLARSTKVVITLAGPFAKLGSLLVKVCAENGTDYCDLTGEVPWVGEMIELNADAAKQTGARIVHLCGHDCVPWDLAVREVAEALKAKGDELDEVHCYDESCGSFSGGTLSSVFYSLENQPPKRSGPSRLLRLPDGKTSENECNTWLPSVPSYSKEAKSYVGLAVMGMVMAKCVKRSQALLGYSKSMTYSEAAVYSSMLSGWVQFVGLCAVGCVVLSPPLSWLLLKLKILPKPGEGPSVDEMNAGFLKLTAKGHGKKGGVATAVFYFPNDPGYRDTARMIVESGLSLALEGDKIKTGGGSFTPASCMGRVLLMRLIRSGSKFALF